MACCVTGVVWSVPLTVSALNDGLGIVRRNGEVILLQGSAARRIDPRLGETAWWAQEIGLVVAVSCGVLSLAVLLRNATIRPTEVFAYDASARQRYPWIIRVGLAALAVPLGIEAGRILWLVIRRLVA